eukprot:7298669-Prymnesium_polylepis.1
MAFTGAVHGVHGGCVRRPSARAANQIEDLVELRAGHEAAARVAEAKRQVSECVFYIKPGGGKPGGRQARC